MSDARSFRETLAQSTLAHVAFGFLAMSAWAVFANRAHPLPQALLSGLVQGTISGLLTLCLKKFLEWFNAKLLERGSSDPHSANVSEQRADAGLTRLSRSEASASPRRETRGPAALILPPLVTATAILIILTTAHTLAGTPEIAATIAVPFTVSTSYAILYNLRLWRAAHGR
jgi:hypothetical protein